MATKNRDSRDLRWNFRVAEAEDELVRAASDSADVSFTSFVRAAAVHEAERVLADRRVFELPEPDWKAFSDLMDRPVRVPAGLRELYSKPSVFE